MTPPKGLASLITPRRSLGPFVVLLIISVFVRGFAQDNSATRHTAAINHLKRVAGEISATCLNDIESLNDWRRERPELQRRLLDMLGLDPLPARTPLQARITGTLSRPLYRIEKIVFQSMPGLYVTGNFYLPKNAIKPLPTILYLCGHSPHPQGAKFSYQDRAAWFAAHGFACLILDTLEFGEVPGIHHGLHDLNMWHWLSLGYTPAGTEVWNAIRAMDYLETRPEVDADRIGLTGISGGGAITWYTSAVDDRVAAAAPVCSTITFGSQAQHWRAFGQCDCIYYPNTYLQDFPVVGALIAPRPLLILSGRKDADFPPDGYHEVFRRSKTIFDLYEGGNSDRIRERDADVGHTDAPEFQSAARQWMWRWLKAGNETFPSDDFVVPKQTAATLACLTDLPPDAINYSIHDRLIPTPKLTDPVSLNAWQSRRTELLQQLRQKVFRWFPEEPPPFKSRFGRAGEGWTPRYVDYREVTFETEPGVRVRGRLLTPKNPSENAPLVMTTRRAGDSIYFMDMDELLPLLGRCPVFILQPRFTEDSLTAAAYRDIQMTASWSGRTIATMQTWDILRSIAWAREEGGFANTPIVIHGKGDMGILGLYAAVLDGTISHVVMDSPPESHWRGPALLNVLRVTDVAEVAGAMAPRKLTLLGKSSPKFGLTKEIYKLHGFDNRFTRTDSLAAAIEVWRFPLRIAEKPNQ